MPILTLSHVRLQERQLCSGFQRGQFGHDWGHLLDMILIIRTYEEDTA